jgi:MATE family multidrug resistance protein
VRLAGQLLGLAWPIVIARSTQVLVGVSDALLVGHLGQEALAATTGGALDAYTLLILPLGVVSVVSAFASQLIGARDPSAARRFGFYGLAVALLAQVVALALLPSIPWALGRLDLSPEVRGLTAGYLRVRLYSAGAAVGLEALGSYYCGAGNTRLPMLASLSALLLNVAGNWLLIDGRLGLPALGVTGSALASTLATTLAFAGLLAVFLASGGRTRGVAAALSARELGRMLRCGFPMGLNGFAETFAFAVFVNVFVAGFGTTTLAALMIVLQISSLTTLPSFALASSGAVLVGQAIGANTVDLVPRLVRVTLLGAVGWQAFLGLAYLLVWRPLLSLFVASAPSAPALLDAGASFLLLSVVWTLFEALAAAYSEALCAAGDTSITLRARVVLLTLVFAPGAWVLVNRLGAGWMAVSLWFAACGGLLAGVLHRRFHGGAWRRIQLAGPVAHRLVET